MYSHRVERSQAISIAIYHSYHAERKWRDIEAQLKHANIQDSEPRRNGSDLVITCHFA
jgi:hypothetical protein